MVNLCSSGRHLFPRSSIDDFYIVGSQAHCSSCGIHCDISGAENNDIFTDWYRGVNLREFIGFHQVGTGKVFVCRKYTDEVFPRQIHKSRQTGSNTDIDSIVSLFQEFIKRNSAADNGIAFKVYSEPFKKIDFLGNNVLGETKFRDTIDQDTARFMERFQYGHVVTFGDKITGNGQT